MSVASYQNDWILSVSIYLVDYITAVERCMLQVMGVEIFVGFFRVFDVIFHQSEEWLHLVAAFRREEFR